MKFHIPVPIPKTTDSIDAFEKGCGNLVKVDTKIKRVAGLEVRGRIAAFADCSAETGRLQKAYTTQDLKEDPKFRDYVWRITNSLQTWLGSLPTDPDLIFVKGLGIDHPNRFGLACRIGLAFGIPTLAIHDPTPTALKVSQGGLSHLRGSHTIVSSDNRGPTQAIVRTQTGEVPIALSLGGGMDFEAGIREVLRSTQSGRLPYALQEAEKALKGPF